jgi:hypothetical protein
LKSGQNCPDREDYVFAERGNYALKKELINNGKYKKDGKQ